MKQIETQIQDQRLKPKRKLNWKKISVLAGAGALVITGTGLITWAATKQIVKNNQITGNNQEIVLNLPNLTYQTMTTSQFNQVHDKFYAVKNPYIKKLATEQLLFYLPKNDFQELKTEISSHWPQANANFNLAPNLSSLLTEKMINSVGSNLRVWGLNTGYAFDSNLVKLDYGATKWTLDVDQENKTYIRFDLNLGYADSTKSFHLKGRLKDSEDLTQPIEEFTKENLAKIFQQANDLFGGMGSWALNRQGYFIGLDFNGLKDEDTLEWLTDQTVNLQEFDSQVWDYVLNSLKNFNLIKEDVFANGLELFDIDGWNPQKIYVTHRDQVKVNKDKNEVWLGKANSFGTHSIVSKVMVSYKTDTKINFEFTGSYLQNNQWGNY